MARRILTIAVAVAVLAGILWVKGHFAPENVIRRAFLEAKAAFEREEILATMKVFDRAYRDQFGNSFESIAGHVRLLHETYDDLELTLEPPDITLAGDTAELRIRFILWGSAEGQRGYIIGSLTDPCTATLQWAKRREGWRIVTTSDLDIPELRSELERARGG